jgi:two-component system, LytTR family, response regulator
MYSSARDHTMRIMIADDERTARARLRRALGEVAGTEVVGEAADGLSAVAQIRALHPDLAILDVQMPELDGFGVLRALEPAERPAVIFATAFDAYALDAFRVHAVDYVLKPVDGEQLRSAVERVRALLDARTDEVRLRALLDEALASRGALAPRADSADRLLINTDGRLVPVRVADIDWIEAAGNYVRLHVNKSVQMSRDTLSGMEKRLDPARFARIHRSAIVNLDRVKELQAWFSGDFVVLLTTGERLRLSRSFRRAFESRFGRRER